MTQKFQTVRGMRDLLPAQMKKKQSIEDTCRKVFESFGFEPLQTPIVEDLALLTKKGGGGDAIRDEIYFFKDKGDREVGLRFDLTVPLGRIVATNPQLPKPFKRYCIGTVYRYDRPQAKRYREFTQADWDIVGVEGVLAEFETIAVAVNVMQELGLEFVVRINSRPVLETIAQKCGVKPAQIPDCFRLIDKQDKMDWKDIENELTEKGIDAKIVKVLQKNNRAEIEKLQEKNADWTRLKGLLDLFEKNKMDSFIQLDFALARGLDYYTGTVFEISCENTTVGGGGRYDAMVELYGGPATPCVGCSFGVDRLLDLLEAKMESKSNTRVLVAILDQTQQSYGLKVADAFRQNNWNCEVDLLNRNVGKNIEYASKKGIPFVAVVGENEEK
ncbi:MAG: histidine--tRNA ligase, partial [Candidatus Diapherotrites archaeon]|nr:histidine--tRNA ligase [Candidatus Diapherotrites archaeon]